MYDPMMVKPMREELTSLGIKELHSASEVDAELKDLKGTAFVVVNSVCGCAAGNARPAVRKALEGSIKPNKLLTVFAGMEKDAVAQARSYFKGYPPSSPSMALIKDGSIVYMIERHQIEGRNADSIAKEINMAFDTFCK
jgi:putative YphP/YqiW family bacilliredoxin